MIKNSQLLLSVYLHMWITRETCKTAVEYSRAELCVVADLKCFPLNLHTRPI